MSFVRGHFRRTRSGFTYVRPSFRRSGGSGALGIALLVILGVVVSVLLAIVRFVMEHWLVIVGMMATGAAIAGAVMLKDVIRKRRVDSYLRSARILVEGRDDCVEALTRLARRIPVDDPRRTAGEEDLYRTLVAQILADGRISDEEHLRLQRVNATFAFDPQQALAIRESAFDGFMAWVGIDLSQEQEATVRAIATRLDLSRNHTDRQMAIVSERRAQRERQAAWAAQEEARQKAIAAEQAAAKAAEEARQAARAAERERLDELEAQAEAQARLLAKREREARLAVARQREAERWAQLEAQRVAAAAVFDLPQRTAVPVRFKLRRGETCWLAVHANLEDRKATHTGDLVITNKRVLFVSDTTVSVNVSKVLDVAADPETGTLRVIKDGRKTPYEFTVEQPLVVLAHLERSLEESCGDFAGGSLRVE